MKDSKQLAREKRNKYMAEWRLTAAGRKSQRDNIEKISSVRRGIAAAKAVDFIAPPAYFNTNLVQRALTDWGG